MVTKKLKTQLINKHGPESDWKKATNYIPPAGTVVIYEPDDSNPNPRFKIGDGVIDENGNVTGTNVNELPFISVGEAKFEFTKEVNEETGKEEYIITPKGEIFNDYINNRAESYFTHAEGHDTSAFGTASHAEGQGTITNGVAAHAEGIETTSGSEDQIPYVVLHYSSETDGSDIFVKTDDVYVYEGNKEQDTLQAGSLTTTGETVYYWDSTAQGSEPEFFCYGQLKASHSEGLKTKADCSYSHTEGQNTIASGPAAHAEGRNSKALGEFSHVEGNSTTAQRKNSHAEGNNTTAFGSHAHVEGASANPVLNLEDITIEDVTYSPSTWNRDTANADIKAVWDVKKFSLAKCSPTHVEGYNCLALGNYAHAEGQETIAGGLTGKNSGYCAHAEGLRTQALGEAAHAEGKETLARTYAHAEGYKTNAEGFGSHVGGQESSVSDGASYGFAHGYYVKTNHKFAGAIGKALTTGLENQFVIGAYNRVADNALFVIGNGTGQYARHNAFEVLEDADKNVTATLGDAQVVSMGPGGIIQFSSYATPQEALDAGEIDDKCKIYIQLA